MKNKAPWTDRTGNARQSLNATTEHTATTDTLVLAHGVDYGVWLEIAHGGAYQIVIPTIPEAGQAVMRSLQTVFVIGGR
jgi:hypothetical protein